MGTVFSIDVRAPGVPASAVDEVVGWLHHVDATFSTYQPASQISRLAQGVLREDQCTSEVRRVLERCRELGDETDGYFSAYAGDRLDPSGYVKGWAIERASELLTAAGSVNHCVNGGGDVQCAGTARPGEPWRIGIAHPSEAAMLAGVAVGGVAVGDRLAVATSGTAERGRHIVDPRTGGRPDQLHSVTLIGTHLSIVDAYATAAFAMGTAAQQWVAGLVGISGLIMHADGRVSSTG